MRRDLMAQIREEKEITDVLILTHNIDLLFLQTVALAALRASGDPNITVFADAGCAMESFDRQGDSLARLGPHKRSIGAAYRVVPVVPPTGFRFHPKAVLLAGKEHATLFVGSGNLTFGGWRENGEVWSRFDTRNGETGEIAAFREYLHEMLGMIAQPDHIRTVIDNTFQGSTHAWAGSLDRPSGLVGRSSQGPSMLQQIRRLLPGEIDGISVCSPYFDPDGRALQQLAEIVGPSRLNLYVPVRDSNLTEAAVSSLPDLKPIGIHFDQPIPNSREKRHGFVHAKFLAFHSGSQVTLFAGSANCSYAALLAEGNRGNSELFAVRTLSNEEFERDLLSDFTRSSEPLQLMTLVEAEEVDEPQARLWLTAARYSEGRLRISYLPASAEIAACLIDGHHVEVPEGSIAGEIDLPWETVSTKVALRGRIDGIEVSSLSIWIDQEAQLSVSARDREIRRQIGDRVRSGIWGLDAWNGILDTLVKQMVQQNTLRVPTRHQSDGDKKDREIVFSAADIAVDPFSLPLPHAQNVLGGGTDRIGLLRKLLLRWLGVAEEEPDTEIIDANDAEEGDADAVGERLYRHLDAPSVPVASPPATQPQRKRAERVVKALADAVCSESYLLNREPELLAGDIALSSALLRTALKEEWISQDLFVETTLRIWYTLFLSSSLNESRGWIECRMLLDDSPDVFRARMQNPQVAAALALWITALPREVTTGSHSVLLLAAVISIARLPWLWHDVERDSLAVELARMVEATAHGEGWAVEWEEIQDRWRDLMTWGSSFRMFDRMLGGHSPAQLKEIIDAEELAPGELLWQSANNGFCVVQDGVKRRKGYQANVYRLQKQLGVATFAADFTIPVGSLMTSDRSPVVSELTESMRSGVSILLETLQQGFITDLQSQKQARGGRISETIKQLQDSRKKPPPAGD